MTDKPAAGSRRIPESVYHMAIQNMEAQRRTRYLHMFSLGFTLGMVACVLLDMAVGR